MPTLSTGEILTDTIDAFKKRFPLLSAVSTDFSSSTAKLNETVYAKVLKLPAASTYDATTGYENGATSSTSLFEDVAITISGHAHVPAKVAYLDAIKSKHDLYEAAIGNLAFSLGKKIVDDGLAKLVAANFSQSQTTTVANSDKDFLDAARIALNTKGAAPTGRFGIVSSAVSGTLLADSRITSRDFAGQTNDANAYMVLKGVSGFENVFEYPDMPANAINLSAFFGDKSALCLSTRLPDDPGAIAAALGLPKTCATEIIQDADTGLAFLGITWQKPGTFDVFITVTVLYGWHAGKENGNAGTKTDYAGLLNVTV